MGLLVLYSYGLVNKPWLDRIIILVNTLIAVLFAPAVLDPTGVFGRAVDWIEYKTHRLYSISSDHLPWVGKLFDRLAGRDIFSVIFSLGLSAAIIWGHIYFGISFYLLIVAIMFPFSVLAGLIDVIYRVVTGKKIGLVGTIVTIFLFPSLFPIIMCAIPVLFLVRLVLHVTTIVSAGINGTVSQREAFRSAIIGWGILIAIMEGLVQFISSF
jgi:hypothetical protein